MPKIIYKPPKSVTDKGDFGTREKSQRKRTEKQIYQADIPVKKVPKSKKKSGLWSVKEKPILLRKIKEHGSSNTALLLDPELKKNEDQIKDLIQFYKKGNRMKEVLKVNAKAPYDTNWVPRQIDNPIESWISLAESCKIPPGSGLMDCSHILADSLSVIINEEKHPKPEDCHGIDYAEIYKYIYSLLNGEVPKQPNQATARKILEMMNELKETVMSATSNENFKQEKILLERYTLRDIAAFNVPFVGKCNDKEIKDLCEMPKINPLNIPPSFFSKPFLSKESKSSVQK